MVIEIKYTVNVVHLDHPETITLPQSMGKLSFMKLVPGAKKVGDCCPRSRPWVSLRRCPGALGLLLGSARVQTALQPYLNLTNNPCKENDQNQLSNLLKVCTASGSMGESRFELRSDSRVHPGGGHGNPLQCSCLENPMDRGAWWATVHRVPQSWP